MGSLTPLPSCARRYAELQVVLFRNVLIELGGCEASVSQEEAEKMVPAALPKVVRRGRR
jgi:hypothetical protein